MEYIEYEGPLLKQATGHTVYLKAIDDFLRSRGFDDKAYQEFICKNDWNAQFSIHIDELLSA